MKLDRKVTPDDIDNLLRRNQQFFRTYPNQWIAVSIVSETVIANAKSKKDLDVKLTSCRLDPNDVIACLPTDVYRNAVLN